MYDCRAPRGRVVETLDWIDPGVADSPEREGSLEPYRGCVLVTLVSNHVRVSQLPQKLIQKVNARNQQLYLQSPCPNVNAQ